MLFFFYHIFLHFTTVWVTVRPIFETNLSYLMLLQITGAGTIAATYHSTKLEV